MSKAASMISTILLMLATLLLMSGFRFGGRRHKRRRAKRRQQHSGCSVCPLSTMGAGQEVCLVCANVNRRLQRRLAELGLTPGVEMVILQNSGGPVLISVRQSRLALGRATASQLSVSPLSSGEHE